MARRRTKRDDPDSAYGLTRSRSNHKISDTAPTALCAWTTSDHRIACSDTYEGPVRDNMRSHIYHWPGYPNYNDIADHNRIEFANAISAEKAGYRAARNCP